MDTKLTVRVPLELLENAKRYAKSHDTTLTRLISTFLRHIPAEDESLADAPLVRRLTGILSTDIATNDYKQHLEEKYGNQ